jgi:hypothetical protein
VPFTLSHPAAVLPLTGTALPTAGLVTGSLVPDLPLYAPHQPIDYPLTHSVVGVFTVDVVLGLVCVVAWWRLLGPAAQAAAPDPVRRRLAPRAPTGLALVPALVIGALTHVGWDAFTHPGRWGVRHISAGSRTSRIRCWASSGRSTPAGSSGRC